MREPVSLLSPTSKLAVRIPVLFGTGAVYPTLLDAVWNDSNDSTAALVVFAVLTGFGWVVITHNNACPMSVGMR